jgi:hypothetical protein
MRARRDTQITVVTSDAGDMRQLAEDADTGVTIVAV